MRAPETNGILVVDDDIAVAHTIADLLRYHGYEVALAYDGREAMDFLGGNRVAMIISDIFMPEGDGLELLNHLRRFTPQPPVLAMSGAGCLRVPTTLRMAGVLGASRTLAKPFAPSELLALVRELIGPAV